MAPEGFCFVRFKMPLLISEKSPPENLKNPPPKNRGKVPKRTNRVKDNRDGQVQIGKPLRLNTPPLSGPREKDHILTRYAFVLETTTVTVARKSATEGVWLKIGSVQRAYTQRGQGKVHDIQGKKGDFPKNLLRQKIALNIFFMIKFLF